MKKKFLTICFLILFFTGFNSKAFNVDTLFICKNSCINYTNITTSGIAVDWVWTFQGATPSSSSIQNPPNICYPNAGIFLTTVKTTFNDATDTTDSVFVVVYDWPIPSFQFPKDTGYCLGSNFPLVLNTITFPGVKYNWSTGAASMSITVNTQGKYWVNVLLKGGNNLCDSVYKEVTITEYNNPVVNLGPDRFMCQNQIIILNAGGKAGDKYLWQPNNEVTMTINVTLPGIYSVRITDVNACFAEDEIEMLDSCPHYVYVPNAVSPNVDGLNDLFTKVWNFTPKEYTFSIFNRWGELLFETNDPNAGWDCKVNGELVSQDIYVYKIVYVDNNKKWYEMRGTLFVVR